jgi:hypothetical protein
MTQGPRIEDCAIFYAHPTLDAFAQAVEAKRRLICGDPHVHADGNAFTSSPATDAAGSAGN